jgi:coenzyme Q-binding protein COQ10
MKVHTERKILPFKPAEIFELVGDVAGYPEFLPWCTGARVRDRQQTSTGETMVADLRIDVDYLQGPFKTLKNHWTFSATSAGECQIDFHLEFEFSSVLLQKLIGVLFHEAVRRMVAAFETRAYQLYTPISK